MSRQREPQEITYTGEVTNHAMNRTTKQRKDPRVLRAARSQPVNENAGNAERKMVQSSPVRKCEMNAR